MWREGERYFASQRRVYSAPHVFEAIVDVEGAGLCLGRVPDDVHGGNAEETGRVVKHTVWVVAHDKALENGPLVNRVYPTAHSESIESVLMDDVGSVGRLNTWTLTSCIDGDIPGSEREGCSLEGG